MQINKKWNIELNEQYKKIAIPILLQGMLFGVFEIFNTIVVSGISQKSLVIMGIISQIHFIFLLFSYGASNGISMFIAQFIGKKDWQGLNKTLAVSKIIYLILVLLYLIFLLFFKTLVISLYTKDHVIIHECTKVLNVIAFGTIIRFATAFFVDAFRALDKAKYLLYLLIISSLANLIISPILCYGLFHFPNLGIYGAVIGYTCSNIITFIGYIYLITRSDNPMELSLHALKYVDLVFVKKLLKKMLPLLIMEVIWSIGVSGYTIILGSRGESYLAAAQLTGSVISFFMTFYSSMNGATSTIIGRTLGTNELEKVKYFTKKLLLYATIIGLSANFVLVVFAPQILYIFNLNGKIPPQTLKIAYLVLVARSARIGVGSMAVTLINGVLKAGGDTIFIPLIELSAIIFFGLGFSYLALILNWNVFFLALGMSVEQLARLIFGYIRYRQYKWLNNLTN